MVCYAQKCLKNKKAFLLYPTMIIPLFPGEKKKGFGFFDLPVLILASTTSDEHRCLLKR